MSTEPTRPTAAVAAGFIVVASVAAMDPSGWFPFGTAKWYAVLLAIVVALWVAVQTTTGGGNTARADVPRWLVVGWAVLLVVLFVAAVFGREPLYAWIGTPERRLGWLTWVLFGACCWIGTRLGSATNVRVVARMVSASALFVGLYALVELVNGAPIPVTTAGQRIGGPYGSSAFLGAALCLLLPVSFAVALDRFETSVWRWVGGAGATLGVIALIGSGTRAAFVGLGIATVTVALAALGRRRSIGRPTARVVAVGFVAVVAVVIAALTVGLVENPVTERLDDNVGRLVDVTASSRLDEWRVGVRIVSAHPVLGVGPEGYRTALGDGITADYERTYGRDVIPDRAHNGIIDVAAAGGLVAGAAYGVLLAGTLIAAWRRLRRGLSSPAHDDFPQADSALLTAGIAAAVVAYAAQQMFLFPLSILDPILWLFIGMIVAPMPRSGPAAAPARSRRASRVVGLVGSVVVVAVAVAAVLEISADRLAAQASAAAANGSPGSGPTALSLAERATSLRPDVLRYHMLSDRQQPMTITGIDDALASLDDAATISPGDPVVQRRRAERLLDLAIATGTTEDQASAIEAWQALATDDNCYQCHLGLGYAYALSGDIGPAIDAFERAAQLAKAGDNEAADAVATLRAKQAEADATP